MKVFLSSVTFGIIAGSLAVLAQPIFNIQPPEAYGICTICHVRDLINWIVNTLFSINFESAKVSIQYPLLTTIGIIIGSLVSSKLNGEFKLIKTENILKMFLLGLIVSIFGLLIMSCPTRLILRFSFGDPFAFIAILGLLAGIFIGVIFIKRF